MGQQQSTSGGLAPPAPAPEPAPRTAVVLLDHSKAAAHSFEWALANVLRPQDRVHLLSVKPPAPQERESFDDVAAPRNTTEAERARWEKSCVDLDKTLEGAEARGKAAGLRNVVVATVDASANTSNAVANAATEFIAERDADFCVMGSRGHSAGAARMLSLIGLGSVSELCVRDARCTVIVVK